MQYIESTTNFKKRWYGYTESFRNDSFKYILGKELNPEPKDDRGKSVGV